MLPDRVSNPGPLTYESGVLPIALRGPAFLKKRKKKRKYVARPGIELTSQVPYRLRYAARLTPKGKTNTEYFYLLSLPNMIS